MYRKNFLTTEQARKKPIFQGFRGGFRCFMYVYERQSGAQKKNVDS